MVLSWLLIFKIVAFLVAILIVISLFVQLSWLTKLRLIATFLVGIILIGFLAWPLAAPSDPFGPVLAGGISLGGAITLACLAFSAGLLAYFLCWPYGREIGVLAVPAGLSIWAVRCGSMADLVQQKATLLQQQQLATLAQRQELFATLKWEPIFWLAIVAAGFAGVLIGWKIARPKTKPGKSEEKPNSKSNIYLNAVIALVLSVLIAQFCIRIFAQDIKILDNRLGSIVAQPAVGQILFAVLVSFGIAAFVVKKFLNAGYIWPIAASAFVTLFVISAYAKQDLLQNLVSRHPAVFFFNAGVSILPIQMVAFGTLGSIVGYWLAVRYDYWRKHEI